MSPTHATALSALLALVLGSMLVVPSVCIAHADAGRMAQRHFDLVNATFDNVTALAIAPADSNAFHDIPLGQPLQGGLTSMTFDVPAGGCLRDLRVTFHGERTQLFPHIDVCRSTGLRLMPHGDRSKPSGT